MTPNNPPQTRLTSATIIVLRLVWVVLFIFLAVVFVGGIPFRFEELVTLCPAEPCILTLRAEEGQVLQEMGLSLSLYALYHLGIEVVFGLIISLLAVFLFWQRFDEPMGILLAYMLILFGLNFMVETDSAFVDHYPNLENIHSILSTLTYIPFLFLIYLFPDGRFVPRWPRYFVYLQAILTIIDPFLQLTEVPSGGFSYVLVIVFLIIIILGIGSQIHRFRTVSNQVQKQQTKWVVLGFAGLMVPILGWSFFIELFPLTPGLPRLLFNTLIYGFMALFLFFFPISFFIAIMRYRLWDIDLLIRRTLVYSILTGALVVVYFGSVVVVQTAVNSLTGRQQTSQLTIALSTLLIAALFTPLRRRVQSLIDRRFFRRKYDAQQVLAKFATAVRDEVELGKLTAALLSVSSETMQPHHISLWLKPEVEK